MSHLQIPPTVPKALFRGQGPLGDEGIISRHPTLHLRYVDTDMQAQAVNLLQVDG